MNLLRTMLVPLLLALAAQTPAAEERDRVLIRHMPDPAFVAAGTLPMVGFAPHTFSSSPMVMGRLFPPTLIMQRQNELDLTDQQQETIKAELRDFQSRVVDVQWDLQSSQGELESLLAEDHIDPEAAGGAIDRVIAAETALKKLHLNLLIRIRNALTPEQIEKLSDGFGPHRAWMMPLAPQPPEAPEHP